MNYKFIKNNFKFYLAIKFIEMSKKVKSDNQSLQIPKLILLTAKLLQSISLNLVTRFAAKLFTTPIKHKIPKRELHMDNNSIQQLVRIPAINKETLEFENVNYLEHKNSDKYLFYTDEVLKGNNYDNGTINNFDLKLNPVNNYCPKCKEKTLDFTVTMYTD